MSRPFRVYKSGDGWFLQHQYPVMRHGVYTYPVTFGFATAGEAIDYAYKNWPWWL